jgi:hypothetical protein
MVLLQNQGFEERKGASLLGPVFAGDYGSFTVQRDRLRWLYERRQAFLTFLEHTVPMSPKLTVRRSEGQGRSAQSAISLD